MTLFRELLNKQGQSYELKFGETFHPTGDPDTVTEQLRDFVTQAMPRGATRFR